MSGGTFDPEKHLDHMSGILGLTVEADWRPAVAANLSLAARMSALVTAFPLDDHEEPASVFEADR